MKTMGKRIMSLVLSLMMVLGVTMIGTGTLKASAAGYNPDDAITYAKAHWNDGSGDCQAFVKACLKAGGVTISSSGVENVKNALVNGGYGTAYKLTSSASGYGQVVKASSNSGKVKVGDILFTYCSTHGYTHTVIMGGTDSSGYITVYAHNSAKNNQKYYADCSSGCSESKISVYSVSMNTTTTYNLTVNYYSNYADKSFSNPLNAVGSDKNVLVKTYTYSIDDYGGEGGLHNYSKSTDGTYLGRTGYTATGNWNTKADGTGISVSQYTAFSSLNALASALGKNVTNGNASVNLYPEWTANTLTVNYYSNYADKSFSNPLNAIGSDKNVLVKTYTYSIDDYGGEGGLHNYSKSTDGTYLGRTGYTATGNWNTKADGTGISVSQYTAFSSLNALASALGKNVTNGNASVNLYPEWTINTYTVSYNANGGSGAPASQSKIYGTNLTLTSSKPTRTNYTFKNWNTKADGSGTSYISGGTYSTNAAVTLYAQWMLNSYTLSYNTNGGIGTPASQTGNGSITLSSTKPTKSGYTFQGWATSASATSAQYQPGATFNLATNTTLYAVWKQDPVTPTTFTLTYDANNGTGAPASQTGNDQITLSTAKPSRSGYTFLGWATSANATSAQYQPGATFNLTANTTLYAVWQKNDMPVTPSNPTASAKLKVKSSTTVDYRSKVNITAMASGVPDGYVLAIYEGKVLKEKGTKDKVTYTPVDGSGKPVELTGDKTFTVKVIDAKGNVQKDGNGKDLTAKVEIKVKSGFFDKLIAFFKGLFGLLPTVDIKP